MTRVILLHQGYHEPDRLQERGQSLAVMLARPLPQRAYDRIEALDAVGVGRLRQRRYRERCHHADLRLLVRESVTDDLDELPQVRQHRAAHQERDLLHDLDPSVPGHPALAAAAHRLQEREEARHAQGRGHHREGARRRVPDVFVGAVDVGSHRGYHRAEPCRLREVAYDLPSLDAGVVILVDEEGLDHGQYPMDVRPHEVVELVQDAVDDLDEEVTLLILEGGAHQQG